MLWNRSRAGFLLGVRYWVLGFGWLSVKPLSGLPKRKWNSDRICQSLTRGISRIVLTIGKKIEFISSSNPACEAQF